MKTGKCVQYNELSYFYYEGESDNTELLNWLHKTESYSTCEIDGDLVVDRYGMYLISLIPGYYYVCGSIGYIERRTQQSFENTYRLEE